VGAVSPILAADEVTKLSPAKQRDKLRYLGARDLVQAEETHVSRLRCLLEHFRDPIQVQKILTREEIKVPSASFMMCDPCRMSVQIILNQVIFGEAETMLKLHEKLLSELQEAVRASSYSGIAQAFSSGQYLKVCRTCEFLFVTAHSPLILRLT
jgi:hypothetical protein